jgi:hypothetical protein
LATVFWHKDGAALLAFSRPTDGSFRRPAYHLTQVRKVPVDHVDQPDKLPLQARDPTLVYFDHDQSLGNSL